MPGKSDSAKAAKESVQSTQRFSRGVMDSAQQIWLAGLGALSRTQQEGSKFFDTLVEEGGKLQDKTRGYTQEQIKRAREQAGPWIDEARRRTGDAFGRLEKVFDDRIARAMERMGVPSRKDMDALSARIDELTRELRASRTRPRGTGARKSAAGKSDAGKT
jgi:poly(hydroxyalkanoate) granule-associated protein